MRPVTLAALLAALTLSGFTASTAQANDTGLAGSLHTLKRERGKLCQVGHFHYGGGSGKNRNIALKAAVRKWEDFTSFEYGTDWGRFRRAANKGKKCFKTGSGDYSCQVSARPCKR